MLRGLLAAGGACALVAGAAVAGHAAQATSGTPATSATSVTSTSATTLAGAAAGGDDLADLGRDGPGAEVGAQSATRCAQVPQAITRTRQLEQRLAGDATTPGSLAYLRHRIDTARSEHHDQLATALQKRLEFRTQLAAFLPRRLALLQTAQTTICSPAPGSSS